ncbi:CAP domain-containing protein [Sphingomonas bacterium]|uniref:CAP domain-containing protein n=1 Tax=Sphingomonas bacterium TaxID=1895847 RepID=UPI0015761077|nr:CAP domain-containing protein [Sphingomonas bacterium]
MILPLIVAADLAGHWPDDMAGSPAMSSAVLAELNRARTAPASLVAALREESGSFHDRLLSRAGAEAAFMTQEGVAPVIEAIGFVDREPATVELASSPVLAAAAADHRMEQSATGLTGHGGSDGSTPADRVRRYGGERYVGEVITYGSRDPGDIVRQLIVDDGVADRGHRRLMFDPSLRYAGVSCGTHPAYRYVCVVTFGRTPDGRPLRD